MILYNTIKNIICKYNSFYGIKMIIINNYLTGTYVTVTLMSIRAVECFSIRLICILS